MLNSILQISTCNLCLLITLIDKVSLSVLWRGREGRGGEGRGKKGKEGEGRGVKSSISVYFHIGYPVPLRWRQNVTVFVHINNKTINISHLRDELFIHRFVLHGYELHAIKSTVEQN